MITIDADIYYEAPRPVSTSKVTVTLLKEEGPGGGNPWYAFTGELEDLREFLLAHNFGGQFDEGVEFYLEPSGRHVMDLLKRH